MNDFGNVITRPVDVTGSQTSTLTATRIATAAHPDNRPDIYSQPVQSKLPGEDIENQDNRDSAQDEAPPDVVIHPVGSRYHPPSNKLRRKLKERHINMMAFSNVVGVGFFLQNGRVIYLAGPGMAFLIYPIVVSVIWAVMGGLGEMTALYPVPGALFELPARFFDQSAGYAVGWMAWFAWVVNIATELDTVATLFDFQFDSSYLRTYHYPSDSLLWPTVGVNPAIWVAVFGIISFSVNMLPIRVYGEVEYWIGVIKMFFFVGLILFQLGLNLETGTGDQYYRSPYNFITQNFTIPGSTISEDITIHGVKAQLAGVWTAIVMAICGLVGFESVALTAAENEEFDPVQRKFATKESIMISTRKISIRILMLYSLSTLLVSFNVPQNDPQLIDPGIHSVRGGQHAAFIIAAVRARKKFWPSFINGVFLLCAVSAAINSVYLSSRLLHALALAKPAWPDYIWARSTREWLERVNSSGLRKGVPQNAVLLSSLFGMLGFLACSKGPEQELGRLATNSSASMLIVYIIVCFTYLKFKTTLRRAAGGVFPKNAEVDGEMDPRAFDRNSRLTYPYRSTAQPFRAFMAGISCIIIVVFNGWRTVKPFQVSDFLASYTSVIAFIVIWAAYRIRFLRGRALCFELSPSTDMRNPTAVRRGSDIPRRDRLDLNSKGFCSSQNLVNVAKWAWTWLK